MPTGTVKWFNNAKGFGFILPDEGGEDLFAHYSCIEMEGYKTLRAGQIVAFEIQQGDKGLHATHIRTNTTNKNTSPHNTDGPETGTKHSQSSAQDENSLESLTD